MSECDPIIERNARVEMDKAWEKSFTRRAIIAVFTYVIIGGYLQILKVEGAWLHAVVPAVAYLLSTLCLSQLKQTWLKHIHTSKEGS